jgi:hypothetical protein
MRSDPQTLQPVYVGLNLQIRWSPVATASYQMLPEVKILQPFSGSEAQQLVALCPKKVFDIEDMGSKVQPFT